VKFADRDEQAVWIASAAATLARRGATSDVAISSADAVVEAYRERMTDLAAKRDTEDRQG